MFETERGRYDLWGMDSWMSEIHLRLTQCLVPPLAAAPMLEMLRRNFDLVGADHRITRLRSVASKANHVSRIQFR